MKDSKSYIKKIHVLFSKDDDFYIAHCLEFDIVTDGKSFKDVKNNIIEATINHITFCIERGNQDKIMNPAPDKYWRDPNIQKIDISFKFLIDYKYNNTELPFYHNVIEKVFNESFINA